MLLYFLPYLSHLLSYTPDFLLLITRISAYLLYFMLLLHSFISSLLTAFPMASCLFSLLLIHHPCSSFLVITFLPFSPVRPSFLLSSSLLLPYSSLLLLPSSLSIHFFLLSHVLCFLPLYLTDSTFPVTLASTFYSSLLSSSSRFPFLFCVSLFSCFSIDSFCRLDFRLSLILVFSAYTLFHDLPSFT